MKSAIQINVKGSVQGVLYRASAVEIAEKLKVTGYVRNLEDGSVELYAEGEKEKLEQFRDWCMKGPKGARVDDVNFEWLDAMGQFDKFMIKR